MIRSGFAQPSSDYFQIRLQGIESDTPNVTDLSTFLYDLNLLYKIARLSLDENYQEFSFNDDRDKIFSRNGLTLAENDELKLLRIHHGSPFDVAVAVEFAVNAITVVSAIGTSLIFLYNLHEKLQDRLSDAEYKRLRVKVLKEQLTKLRRENRDGSEFRLDIPDDFDMSDELFSEAIRETFRIRGSDRDYQNTIRRLGDNPLEVSDVQISRIRVETLEHSTKEGR